MLLHFGYNKQVDAFKVIKNGKSLDYRVGGELDLSRAKHFFEQEYKVRKLWQGVRHVLGIVEQNHQQYFLKVATTEGISIRSESETLWNEQFNRLNNRTEFSVPKIIESGYFNDLLFLITDYFEGQKLSEIDGSNNNISKHLETVIDFSQNIQGLPLNIPVNDAIQNPNAQAWFIAKTKTWLNSIPENIIKRYSVQKLFGFVSEGAAELDEKPRHGDFTPWHIILVKQGLGLIDGEHAHSHGVEYYDICYFIQRVYSVLKMPELVLKIFDELMNRKYNKEKLRTVLASRAIGGFLDESLKPAPDYQTASSFANWVQVLG